MGRPSFRQGLPESRLHGRTQFYKNPLPSGYALVPTGSVGMQSRRAAPRITISVWRYGTQRVLHCIPTRRVGTSVSWAFVYNDERSSVGMQLATLRRRIWQRWSSAKCVPTLERDRRLFLLAISFYTRLPHPQALDYQQLPRAAVYLPLIGWLVGGICALVFYLADLLWPQTTAVILALIASILTTGALHEDGLADVCDGFGGGTDKQRILEIMKDSHIGVYGVLGLSLMLLLKISVLIALPAAAVPLVLLAGHSLSRLSPLLLMQRYNYARGNDSKSSGAVYKPTLQELAFAAVIALLPLALLPALCVLAIIPLLLATMLLGHYFYRRIGGYTGDCLGASQQVAETVFYLSVSALWIFI